VILLPLSSGPLSGTGAAADPFCDRLATLEMMPFDAGLGLGSGSWAFCLSVLSSSDEVEVSSPVGSGAKELATRLMLLPIPTELFRCGVMFRPI
jgi:hypothetical protein